MPRSSDTVITANKVFAAARKRLPSPHRAGQCISRPEFADAVNRALDRLYPGLNRESLYVDHRWVGKVERGESRWPVDERRAALREVFGVAANIDLGLYSPRHTTELSEFHEGSKLVEVVEREEFPPRMAGAAEILLRPAASAYVPFLPAALDQAAQNWLHCKAPLRALAPVGGRIVEPEFVLEAAGRLRLLREMDHEQGAGVAGKQVSAFITGRMQSLIIAPYGDPDLRVAGHRVAVAARELAGYQAVDSGADGVAQRHYLHALSLASAIEDRSLGAYLLGVSLGHLALHRGHPQLGLRLAQTALAGVGSSTTSAVLASLWAVVARAYARLGDEPACTVALRSAEMQLASSKAIAEPEWINYLTPAYLADEVAHCMFDLCRHDSAQREIKEAVNGVGASRVRRLVIDTALLASSLAATGSIDEACARGREAVDLAARTTSARAVQRVAQVRADLIPYEDVRAVRELIEYIHDLLPAAV